MVGIFEKMQPLLSGRTILVTGGARGIGRDISRVLARHGANVAVNYSASEEKALKTVAEIEAEGGKQLWQRDTHTDFGAQPGYFGAGSSPIVVGDLVIVNVGGTKVAGKKADCGVVAFRLDSGEFQVVDVGSCEQRQKRRVEILLHKRPYRPWQS
jgi:NAD(P)-dependent dehydrogenase (short-subunit alcohol dehydrogenase family)